METFVVRVFTPAVPQPSMREGALSGVVEHVASGGRLAFSDAAELLAFLRDRAGAHAPASAAGREPATGEGSG